MFLGGFVADDKVQWYVFTVIIWYHVIFYRPQKSPLTCNWLSTSCPNNDRRNTSNLLLRKYSIWRWCRPNYHLGYIIHANHWSTIINWYSNKKKGGGEISISNCKSTIDNTKQLSKTRFVALLKKPKNTLSLICYLYTTTSEHKKADHWQRSGHLKESNM